MSLWGDIITGVGHLLGVNNQHDQAAPTTTTTTIAIRRPAATVPSIGGGNTNIFGEQQSVSPLTPAPQLPAQPTIQAQPLQSPDIQATLQRLRSQEQQNLQPTVVQPQQDTGIQKFEDIAGQIPLLGSVMKLESAGVEGLANLFGNKDLANKESDIRTHLSLGMGNDEVNALPQSQQSKLRVLEGLDTGASPLDFLGLTSLVKAPIVTGLKDAAKEAITKGAISDATKQVVAQGVKKQVKNAAIGGAIGSAVSAGSQAYLNNGQINPLGVLKGGIVGSALGLATPFGETRKPNLINAEEAPQPEEITAGLKQAATDAAEEAPSTRTPEAPEVAPGVKVKPQPATVLVADATPPVETPQVPAPTPVVPLRASAEVPTERIATPVKPKVAAPEVASAKTAAKEAVNESETAPKPEPEAQSTEKVTTPIEEASTKVPETAAVDENGKPLKDNTSTYNLRGLNAQANRAVSQGKTDAVAELHKQISEETKGASKDVVAAQKEVIAARERVAYLRSQGVSAKESTSAMRDLADKQHTLDEVMSEHDRRATAAKENATPVKTSTKEATPTPVEKPVKASKTVAKTAEAPRKPTLKEIAAKSESDKKAAKAPVKTTAKTTAIKRSEGKVEKGTPYKATTKKKVLASSNSKASEKRVKEVSSTKSKLLETGKNKLSDKDIVKTADALAKKYDTSEGNTELGLLSGISRDKRFKGVGAEARQSIKRLDNAAGRALARGLSERNQLNRSNMSLEDLDDRTVALIEEDRDGKATGLKVSPEDQKVIHEKNQAYVDARDNFNDKLDKYMNAKGDAATERAEKALNEAREKLEAADNDSQGTGIKTLRKLVKQNPTPENKQRLQEAEDDYTYMQSYVKANYLFQIPGRTADQINKQVAQISDAVTDALGAKGLANNSFRKTVGRNVFATTREGKQAVTELGKGRQLRYLRGLNAKMKAAYGNSPASIYRRWSTNFSNAGEMYGKTYKETASYFAADAEAQGIKGKSAIMKYINTQENSSTSDWDKIFKMFSERNERWTGLTSGYGRAKTAPKTLLSKVFGGIDDMITHAVEKTVPGSTSFKRNVADALKVPIIGFPKVIANVSSRGLDYAALGMSDFIKAGRESDPLKRALLFQDGVRSAYIGGSGYAMGVMIGASGAYTGSYPKDAKERARWEAEGIQPYSFKIGDYYFEPGRYLGPLAMPLTIGAAMAGGQNPAAAASATAAQVLENFGASNLITSVQNISDLLGSQDQDTRTKAWSQFVSNYGASMVAGLVPFSSEISNIASDTDPYQRDTTGATNTDTVKDKLINKVPGLREQALDEKTDELGNKLGNRSGVVPAVFAVDGKATGIEKNNAVASELQRLADAGQEAYPSGVSGLSKNYQLKDENGNKISLDDKQQNSLNQAVKEEKSHQASLLIQTDAYKQASDKDKATMLASVYSMDSSGVASQWASDNKVSGVAAKSQAVNDSLSSDDQKALLTYNTMSSDKRDAWLDDNTNALDYYTANYDNKKANGTLSAKDDDLEEKSSARYKMVTAQVNSKFNATPDLALLYQETTEKELENMSDSDPRKAELIAYDKARTEAGVSDNGSDTSLYKYKANGNNGSGGSGSKGISTDAGYLDASTVSPSSTTIKARALKKYDSPIPNLSASTAKTNLKKSITVQNGVKLG